MTQPPTTTPILRPSALDASGPNRNATEPLNLNVLTEQVTRIVRDILIREGRQILTNAANPNADTNDNIDQTININLDQPLSDLDKIPDIAKSLREFSGHASEFSSWKKSVDRILRIYDHLKGTAKYYGILNVVRNKIVGNADIVLESYNTPLSWPKISRCLTLHYADKRDIGTLEYQMTTLVQGPHSIQEFYQIVYQHLSLILNKLSCMDMGEESLNNMTQAYRDKALDTFVRGLKGDLPRLLSIREPVDLPQALHLCLKLQNVDFRIQYANNSQVLQRKQVPPPLPPRRNNPQPFKAHQPFYPELTHNPRVPQQPIFTRPFYPTYKPSPPYNSHFPNKFQPPNKPQWAYPQKLIHRPEPVPMEVDQSMRSRQVNYMNRPHINTQNNHKRAHLGQSHQTHPPNKFQKVYFTEPSPDDTPMGQEPENSNEIQNDDPTDETFEEYVDAYDNPTYDETEILDDIYFLDSDPLRSPTTN